MAQPQFEFTTIGEVLLRYSVPPGQRLEVAAQLGVYAGGAEANVAAALGRLGRRCALATALPASALGRLAANSLRAAGVDLAGVRWREGGRMGVYYVEFAEPPRAIQVIYDRAGSCAAQLSPADLDWDRLLDTRLLHLTGITAALSPTCQEAVAQAAARARAAGVPVSFDVNYRGRLWTPEAAAAALLPIMQGVDLLFCKAADAMRLFGAAGTPAQMLEHLWQTAGARRVVLTLGAEGVLGTDGTNVWHEPAVPTRILDRLGAGDALAAGVIHGWLGGDFRRGLRYGAVMAGLALSQYGDQVITTAAELEALARDIPSEPTILR